MAVTISDRHSVGKTTRFVGICIERGATGLSSFFILRNAIDNQGIEIKYLLYDPTIQVSKMSMIFPYFFYANIFRCFFAISSFFL